MIISCIALLEKAICMLSRFHKKFKINSKLDTIAISIILLLAINYLVTVLPHIHNIPKANDDVKIFLFHLHKLLSNPEFTNFIDYLFTYNNNPHIKLDARLITLITYAIHGLINYKFILIIGHILYLSSFTFLRVTFPKIPIQYFIPIALVFMIPSWSTALWSVAIWGYNTQIFLLCTTAYLISKKYHLRAIIVSFLGSLTLGSGISLFVMGIGYCLFQYFTISKNILKQLLYWCLGFIISLTTLIIVILSSLTRPENSTNQDFDIISLINYNVLFLFNGIKPSSTFNPIILVISYLILLTVLLVLWNKRKEISNYTVLALSMLLVIMAHSFVSSLFRLDVSEIIPNVPDRYEVFSFCFISILLIILFDFYKDSKRPIINLIYTLVLVLSSILYIGKMSIYSVGIEMAETSIKNRLINALVENKNALKKYHILNYLKNGMYVPPFEILRNDVVINHEIYLDSTIIKDADPNINIITNIHSDYYNLTEFYVINNNSKTYLLYWSNNKSLQFQNVAVLKLINFKQNRKLIDKAKHELKDGYILNFPILNDYDVNSKKYILTIDSNGNIESALKL